MHSATSAARAAPSELAMGSIASATSRRLHAGESRPKNARSVSNCGAENTKRTCWAKKSDGCWTVSSGNDLRGTLAAHEGQTPPLPDAVDIAQAGGGQPLQLALQITENVGGIVVDAHLVAPLVMQQRCRAGNEVEVAEHA